MLLSVVGYSLMPLLIVSGNGADSPFLFGAGLRLGVCIASAGFLRDHFISGICADTHITSSAYLADVIHNYQPVYVWFVCLVYPFRRYFGSRYSVRNLADTTNTVHRVSI
jgi:hypothetical protein